MSPTATKKKVTPNQLILIGVLVLTLAFVLFSGQGSSQTGAAKTVTNAAPPVAPAASPKSGVVAPVQWPVVSLDQMLGHNPFESMTDRDVKKSTESSVDADKAAGSNATGGESSPDGEDPRDQKARSLLSEFRSRKVKLIFRTNNKACALIGDRLIKEGEIIDGVKIVSISNNGVVVQHAPEETTTAK